MDIRSFRGKDDADERERLDVTEDGGEASEKEEEAGEVGESDLAGEV